MASRICWTKLIAMILAGLVIALADPGCSETAGRPIPITTGDGGWESVYNLPQGAWIEDLFFVDGRTGWAVGSCGVILKTTNGGVTWSPQNSGTPDKRLTSAWFTDANNGCVVGYGSMKDAPGVGVILRTTDGGVTWQAQKPPEGLSLYSICFIDAKTGWAVGDRGPVRGQPLSNACKLVKTADGGATWSVLSNLETERGGTLDWRVSFADAEHGWICGGSAGLVRTIDGGRTWLKPTTEPRGDVNSVCFVDKDNGWACGSSRGGCIVHRTTDGGDTWIRQANGVPWNTKGPAYPLYSVCFTDSKNGWACGSSGIVLRTTDGGETWATGKTDSHAALQGTKLCKVWFADSQNGWAAGWEGVILRTTDGGKTWTSPQPRTMRSVFAAQFVDTKTGWITGGPGGILKTTDGGLTWVQQRANSDDWINQLCFADDQHGWAVGDNGAAFTTDDGGATWVKQTSWLNGLSSVKTGICQAQFVDSKFGWIVVGDISDSSQSVYSIRRTSDGGATWQTLSTGTLTPINDMWFVDRKTGWEVGPKGMLLKTMDGGNSWTRKFTGTTKHLFGVRFTDPNVGWIVGQDGLMMKSTDGGETWTIQDFGVKDHLGSVCFADAAWGWIGSMGNYILMTTDGGKTWTKQNTGRGNTYRKLCFVDRDHGWIPGPSLLRTTTAGLPGCVWAKRQPDGKRAEFGHLVVTENTSDGLYAVHPDSKIGMRIRIKDPKVRAGDYIYIHGKIATDGSEKVIDADSIDVITSGWGVIKEKHNEEQAKLH